MLCGTTPIRVPYQATPTCLRNTGPLKRKVGPHSLPNSDPIQWPQQWLHLNPTWILTSTPIIFQSYLPHDRGFFSNYPHSSLTPKPLDLTFTLEEIQPCLLGAPCLCQRTGTGLGLILIEIEEVLTSSKQIQVPSPPNFLVTLFHQVPHLSCIPLPYHTSFPSTWKCFPISSCLKSLSSFSPSSPRFSETVYTHCFYLLPRSFLHLMRNYLSHFIRC